MLASAGLAIAFVVKKARSYVVLVYFQAASLAVPEDEAILEKLEVFVNINRLNTVFVGREETNRLAGCFV